MRIDDIKSLVFDSQKMLGTAQLESIVCGQEDASLKSPGIPAHYYRFLYFYCQKFKPNLCLELGTNTGISAACMAEGNPEGKVYTVNNQNELRDYCVRPNVYYIISDSLIPVDIDNIDLLFIDTWHDGVRCKNEFELYKNKMANNGIVFFDDITLLPCMKEFWDSFNPEGWIKFELAIHGAAGFGALIKGD